MPVDFQKFQDWAEKKFGISNVIIRGKEIRINSFFAAEDKKHHLWCNPEGGKNLRPLGVYHCWKTDKKGTLVGLIQEVEKCSKSEALEILGIQKERGRPVEEISFEDEIYQDKELSVDFKTLTLPPHTFLISKAPENWYKKCKRYLDQRKISLEGLYVCVDGKYANRIIIPYYSNKGNLIYFNGRTLGLDELRYKGPGKECGVGKEDVLYFTSFPEKREKIFLCEGEFDAMTLKECGFNSVACGGKYLSDKQALLLSQYNICLALDYDEAGQSALKSMNRKLSSCNFISSDNRITVAMPPEKYKDWNKFFTEHSDRIIKEYIKLSEKPFDESEYNDF